jgi:hypothetical protein
VFINEEGTRGVGEVCMNEEGTRVVGEVCVWMRKEQEE